MPIRKAVSAALSTCALALALPFGDISAAEASRSGVLPTGADGKPLNLDFETGTLKDWTVDGAAFQGQPVRGDTVAQRRPTMKSQHQGEFWIGTYERQGDEPQGTLVSAAFKVTHPYASFLVAGGSTQATAVEIVQKNNGTVIARASGTHVEDLAPVAVDLRKLRGEEIFIRIVDQSSGPWGHVNFDDFRFHENRPAFALASVAGPDEYEHDGLAPEDAARAMILPAGFRAISAAGEPDVHQPIAMALDDRGRLWVAEAYEYPRRAPEGHGRDRILIFEDKDGDGKLETQKVFTEGLNLVSGLEVGFGGVFVGAAPYLMFIADQNGDDRPDAAPEILLDGWGYQDSHETLNTFIWGPDGWLYGNHGVFTHSLVGRPGAPDSEREPINAGIWRYHPTKRKFEVFAHGTSNPWGVDFDDYGQAVCTACVIPHLYHVIQNGRYQRQAGNHFNPFTYADIQTIADHRHYVGSNPHAGNNRSDSMGGGHAHSGAMIYLGGAWPEQYRNQIFMNNIHGQRINVDILERSGSGYIGRHGPDFLLTNDRWSQILNLRYGPDGQVWMIDWYDANACHHNEITGHDRTNGRIFKVVYGETKKVDVDLKKLSDLELVELQLQPNDWYVRHARRVLQERAAAGSLSKEAVAALEKIAFEHADVTRQLRGLWALQATGYFDASHEERGLASKSPYVRAWTVQFATENAGGRPGKATLAKMAELARSDESQVVRLYLASALQKMPVESRWDVLDQLLSHAEDAEDHNLPLMYWYAAESLCEANVAKAMALGARHAERFPELQKFIVRRIGNANDPESLARLIDALRDADDTRTQLAILQGVNNTLKGTRSATAPESWGEAVSKLREASDPTVQVEALTLAVTFGDDAAVEGLKQIVLSDADGELREAALSAIVKARDESLPGLLRDLLNDKSLRGDALRAMASIDDESVPPAIVEVYSSLPLEQRKAALATLAARVSYAEQLLAAVSAEKIPAGELSADLVRQLVNLNEPRITDQVNKLWSVRETSEDKNQQIAHYRELINGHHHDEPDAAAGRAVFAKTCQQCHILFGEGGKVGPELTGSNRTNLDYLLSNIIDPSAVMAKEYMPTLLQLDDGRVVTGIIKSETETALTVQTATELLTISADEVEQRKESSLSMMPDDILKPLADKEIRDLVRYLQSPAQVELAKTELAAADAAAIEQKAPPKITFKKTQLDKAFRSEGATAADFNGDGKVDIAAGSVWYSAPDWKMHTVREKADVFDPHSYSNSFCNFSDDLNGDGRPDLIVVDFPGAQTWWYENPGELDKPWRQNVITPVSNNESPSFLHITDKDKKQLLMAVNPDTANPDGPDRYMAYLTRSEDPYAPWKITRVSNNGAPGTMKYAHGIGAGDVNSDGSIDILVPEGWWEAPADGQEGVWKFHEAKFAQSTAHMHVFDIDGDGDNDVVNSSAHDAGVWWHEQTDEGWVTHLIADNISQTHSLCVADINSDGLPDLITGKRYWAHGPTGDKDPGAPAVMVWYELQRKEGKVNWIAHEFDDDSGVGTQFEVVDVNGDGLLDVVTSNKKGVFYHEQVRE